MVRRRVLWGWGVSASVTQRHSRGGGGGWGGTPQKKERDTGVHFSVSQCTLTDLNHNVKLRAEDPESVNANQGNTAYGFPEDP